MAIIISQISQGKIVSFSLIYCYNKPIDRVDFSIFSL